MGNSITINELGGAKTAGYFVVIDASQARMVNSGVSVGNLYGSDDTLEVVFCIGPTPSAEGRIGDTLNVFGIVRATGELIGGSTHPDSSYVPLAAYPVTFSMWTINGTVPALGDIDGDGVDDIAFATDDSLYLLKMNGTRTLEPVGAGVIGFGSLPSYCIRIHVENIYAGRVDKVQNNYPARRAGRGSYTPQVLIADIDSASGPEVIANHQGDGKIWSFNARNGVRTKRFPLRTKGRVDQSPLVTDLEGDGLLDLVAVDDAGFMYAWQMGPGSLFSQPWPSKYGDSWNTSSTLYRNRGEIGHLYEDWAQPRVKPYAWIETGTGNSLTVVDDGAFVRQDSVLVSNQTGARNYHFDGPGMKSLSNYTITGTMLFDSTASEFGVNFYSQWPQDNKKYSFVRKFNGSIALYYFDGAANHLLDDSTGLAVESDVTYWYRISIKAGVISVKWWNDPADENLEGVQLQAYDTNLDSGTVGVTTISGAGNRFWGPITVTSGDEPDGAFIASEDFASDSSVDIKPYVPANWQPRYGFVSLDRSKTVNGFALDTSSGVLPTLVYRHKPGVTYPVSCLLAPETNLEMKNYQFSGRIIKPNQPQFDTVEVAVGVYSTDGTDGYKISFKDNVVRLSGGGLSSENYSSPTFGAGDTLNFSIEMRTLAIDTVSDSLVTASFKMGINASAESYLFQNVIDKSAGRCVKGNAAVLINLSDVRSEREGLPPIGIYEGSIQKLSLKKD